MPQPDLRVVERRLHAGRRSHEPGPQPLPRPLGAILAVQPGPAQRERGNILHDHVDLGAISRSHLRPVVLTVLRNVGQAVRLRWIRPVVAGVADIVMGIAGGRRLRLVDDRDERRIQGLGRRLFQQHQVSVVCFLKQTTGFHGRGQGRQQSQAGNQKEQETRPLLQPESSSGGNTAGPSSDDGRYDKEQGPLHGQFDQMRGGYYFA